MQVHINEHEGMRQLRERQSVALFMDAIKCRLPEPYEVVSLKKSVEMSVGGSNANFRVFHFEHEHFAKPLAGEFVEPDVERLVVSAWKHNGHIVEIDPLFAGNGKISVDVGVDLPAAILDMAAFFLSEAFPRFEWKKDFHDPMKVRLFSGQMRLATIFRSGTQWASTNGECYPSKCAAVLESERQGKLALREFYLASMKGLNLIAPESPDSEGDLIAFRNNRNGKSGEQMREHLEIR